MNTKPGRSALTAGSPSASIRAEAPRPPHVRSKTSFVTSIAMSQRTPSHWVARRPQRRRHGVPQIGRERVELDDVRPRGEVRVRSRRRRRRPGRTTPGRARASSPRTKYSGCSSSHGWSGATWLGTKSDQPEPVRGFASRGERVGASEPLIHDVVPDAVRRPDDVRRREVGRTRRKPSTSDGFVIAIAIPAGLRFQTPISQTASKPSDATASHSASGTLARPTVAPVGSARRARPCVDLVDERVGDHELSAPPPDRAPRIEQVSTIDDGARVTRRRRDDFRAELLRRSPSSPSACSTRSTAA